MLRKSQTRAISRSIKSPSLSTFLAQLYVTLVLYDKRSVVMKTLILLFISVFTLYAEAQWEDTRKELVASDGENGDYFGYSVDVGQNYAVVGAPSVAMGGAVYIFKKEGDTWVQMQKINALDANIQAGGQFDSNDDVAIDAFGYSVAIAESPNPALIPSTIIVGAPETAVYHNNYNYIVGATCFYDLNTTSQQWQQRGKCIHGVLGYVEEGYSSELGRSVDIDIWQNGTDIYGSAIIGDPGYDMKYSNMGMAVFMSYSVENGWGLQNVITGTSGDAGGDNALYGTTVAIDQSQVIVGVPGYNIEDPNSSGDSTSIIAEVGAVFFYNADGSFLSSYIPSHDEVSGEHHFGRKVDIFGEYAIVSEEHSTGGLSYPCVYILKKGTDGTWSQHNTIDSTNTTFGYDVAINDKHAIITSLSGSGSGSFFAYMKDTNGDWTTRKPFYWLDDSKESGFGIDIGLYDDTAMIGAPIDEHVKVFDYVQQINMNPSVVMYLLN